MESNFGRFYEDFEVNQIHEHFPGKTVLESDNNLFCLLTMNHHPVHLDMEYARNQFHQEILVVGTYVLSLVVGMSVKDISGKAIANLEFSKIIHHNPVFIGDTIYAKTKILRKRLSKSDPTKGIVSVETKAYNQNEQEILTLERKILVWRRTTNEK